MISEVICKGFLVGLCFIDDCMIQTFILYAGEHISVLYTPDSWSLFCRGKIYLVEFLKMCSDTGVASGIHVHIIVFFGEKVNDYN